MTTSLLFHLYTQIGDTTLTADTQPTYMNSEVEAPVKKSADVELLTVTDAAIGEW